MFMGSRYIFLFCNKTVRVLIDYKYEFILDV